ncbi:MAG TPA: hypothetical protein DCW68_05900 [Rhodospirillaceae bacterium]|nr:MAG: hypothetical protein A2018_03465 [Alphaproteobacteria bacterium GWF2_58_20]HAU29626.1 hypothetical protein [Rhodospirillaceae bacterium]
MIWVKGISGFLFGFVCGMALMAWALRKVPKQRLLSDSNLKTAGSALVWVMAAVFSYIATRF